MNNKILKTTISRLKKNKYYLYFIGLILILISQFVKFLPTIIVILNGVAIFLLLVIIALLEFSDYRKNRDD